MSRRLILKIQFANGDTVGLTEDANAYAVDFAWGCLRYFRTGEMPKSKTDVQLFAEAEREYSKQRNRHAPTGCVRVVPPPDDAG